MKSLVLDGSTALGFVLQDEQAPLALKALATIEAGVSALVPAHWCVEVANGLLMAERRGRATRAEITEAFHLIQALPVTVDDETAHRTASDTVGVAREYGLTIYDAAYLELAMRRGASLATDDRDLRKAAVAAGVSVLH
ncbi:MAG: hypothetical protein JWM35_2446 [Verrucomicrobia bacterium]|nr:hypothetical protein [Verrucomicrobiota bacterium]